MCLPTLKKYIYMTFNVSDLVDNATLMEAMTNVMHTTFVTLQSAIKLNQDILKKGHRIFLALLSHFEGTVKVKRIISTMHGLVIVLFMCAEYYT